ncbi:hypothetical protein E4U10_006998, partial [Claviceps purpurea]
MKRTSTRNILRAAALITFPFPYQNRLAMSLAHQPDMPVAPVIALSHGGGPLPLLGDKNHDAIVSSLRNKVPQILRLGTPSAPKAMVLVTAH